MGTLEMTLLHEHFLPMNTKPVTSLELIVREFFVQFSSVSQLCPTLCNPMNCSMPGLPVHHQLLEFTQTHGHPLLLLPSIFPSIRVFSNESTLRMRWPKYWSFRLSISPSDDFHQQVDRAVIIHQAATLCLNIFLLSRSIMSSSTLSLFAQKEREWSLVLSTLCPS